MVFATSNQNKVHQLILVVMSPVLLGSELSDSTDAEGKDHPEKGPLSLCQAFVLKAGAFPSDIPSLTSTVKLKGAGRASVGWPRDREMSLSI